MRTTKNDERTMLRVSDMYYNQNLSQEIIAKKLGLSRPTISKLLASARDKGIVRIIVSDISGRKYFQLEHELEDKFGLKEVAIVETKSSSWDTKLEMGKAASAFLERIIKDRDIVGVSMGTTVAQIPAFVSSMQYTNTLFLPLLGGLGEVETELHGNFIAESMSKAFGGNFLPIHAPAMVSRLKTKTELLKEKSIDRVFKKVKKMDIAILGIGLPDEDSTIIKTGYFSSEMIAETREKEICGDICMKFFDQSGNTNLYAYNENVIAIDLEDLRRVPYSIGVAGGAHKASAIFGSINGKYINVLITDYDCAKALKEMIL
ncbi:MAG: sugar-binding transcriptional regulator [Eubacteriaceae bacterium]